MDKFKKIKIGDKAHIYHQITQDDIKKFVDLTGDDNKLHVDNDFAKNTEFRKPVAHGMLGASFISTLIGTKLPGDGALWFSQNLEFILPVKVGDKLKVSAIVQKKHASSRTIELLTSILNQDNQEVTRGTVKVKIIEDTEIDTRNIKPKKFKNTAVIIGSSGGIGEAVALNLAKNGYDLVLHFHKNKQKAKSLQEKIIKLGKKAYIVSGNIENYDDAEEIAQYSQERLGNIKSLINCSTLPIMPKSFSSLCWDDFEAHLKNQIKGSFNIIRSILPYMEKNNYGKIVQLTTQAIEQPVSGWLPYIASKGALNAFCKALAIEIIPKGIRLNMISPGMTETNLISWIPERAKKLAAAKIPVGNIANPQDIANIAKFLVSGDSDYLVGETIRANGGQTFV